MQINRPGLVWTADDIQLHSDAAQVLVLGGCYDRASHKILYWPLSN